MIDKLDGGSLDIEKVEMEKLRAVFPQCFVEGKLDLSKLLALCGEYDDNDFEKYKFEWKGKSESLRLAQQRSMGTLRPCPEDSVDWDTTQNLYIEGDNLEVLKLLQTAYYRKVKMIYIDPPYNTGNDFVYEDDFKDPINRYKEVTAQTTKSNPETMGRYHTNWLNMMYPRLRLASNLLTDDGVIFISIDDNEVNNLGKICDEIFGEEYHLGTFIWHRRQMADSRNQTRASTDHEYVLAYAKPDAILKGKEIDKGKYSNPDNDPRGDWFSADLTGLANKEQRPNLHYDVVNPATGLSYPPNTTRGWSCSRETMARLIAENRVLWPSKPDGRPRQKKFLAEIDNLTTSFSSMLNVGFTTEGTRVLQDLFTEKLFSYPKPVSLIQTLVEQGTGKDGDIILDFFSGSATTAQAVFEQNKADSIQRRFILVQLPELTESKDFPTICEIGKERIRRAGTKIKAEWDADQLKSNAGLFSEQEEQKTPPDTGFKVFKLDTSNLKTWDATPVDSDDAQQMELLLDRMNDMVNTIKSDRTDTDMVYEIMLKMGVPLIYPVIPVEIGGKQAYSIGEDSLLLVCLQSDLTAEIIEQMAEDYLPSKMILSEKCFADDTAMANAHYILKEREIELKLV